MEIRFASHVDLLDERRVTFLTNLLGDVALKAIAQFDGWQPLQNFFHQGREIRLYSKFVQCHDGPQLDYEFRIIWLDGSFVVWCQERRQFSPASTCRALGPENLIGCVVDEIRRDDRLNDPDFWRLVRIPDLFPCRLPTAWLCPSGPSHLTPCRISSIKKPRSGSGSR